MIPLAGILIVLGAVIAGFLMESGDLRKLAQPAELLIIIGSALGAAMVANPAARLIATGRRLWRAFRKPVYTKERYLATLTMLYGIFQFARRHGSTALEDAVDDPAKSLLFNGMDPRARDPETMDFVCDTLRVSALGAVSPYNLDAMVESDLDVRREEAGGPVRSLELLADSLPGFGIVSAVLGVILSMGAIREAPLRLGLKIASALIGTFTGILLAYGIVSPLSARLGKIEDADAQYFDVLRAGLIAFAKGMPPSIAVECARRAVPPELRPDFAQTEDACRGSPRRNLSLTA